MNWYIFSIVVLAGVTVLTCGWCYYIGNRNGYAVGYEQGESYARNSGTEHERIAYQNGHRKGFQVGVDHQKRIYAERARESSRRDSTGRFKKKA